MNLIPLALWFGLAMAGHKGAGCVAGDQCQCLFSDGSHCCVYGYNAKTGDTPLNDCKAVCNGASRLLQGDENTPAKCNAGGAYSCVGLITAQGRTPCYNSADAPP